MSDTNNGFTTNANRYSRFVVVDKVNEPTKARDLKINSKDSVGKLQSMGFDPIESMLATYKDIADNLEQMRTMPRRSFVAEAQMYGMLQKISTDLIKYGYHTVQESEVARRLDGEHEDTAPTQIVFSDEDTVRGDADEDPVGES